MDAHRGLALRVPCGLERLSVGCGWRAYPHTFTPPAPAGSRLAAPVGLRLAARARPIPGRRPGQPRCGGLVPESTLLLCCLPVRAGPGFGLTGPAAGRLPHGAQVRLQGGVTAGDVTSPSGVPPGPARASWVRPHTAGRWPRAGESAAYARERRHPLAQLCAKRCQELGSWAGGLLLRGLLHLPILP